MMKSATVDSITDWHLAQFRSAIHKKMRTRLVSELSLTDTVADDYSLSA